MSGAPPARFAPLRGVLLLARGRAEGLACFRGTQEGFLASLAPLLAVPLAGAALLLLGGAAVQAAALLLLALVSQLAPPVLSHALARAFGQEEGWLRYATAYNWCQWAVLAVMAVLLVALAVVTGGSPAAVIGSPAFGYAAGGYAMWLHWVLARHGLGLPGWRAAALVLLVGLGTMILVIGPPLVRALRDLQPDALG
jgi:hypothetical protein